MGKVAAVGLLGMTLAAPASAQQADPGKAAFAPCAGCHAVTAGTNRIGPTLYKVVGRKIAGVPGYTYSDAMKAKKGNWTPAALDAYLADPRGNVAGTKMSFPGVKDPVRRAALVNYLKTLK